MEQIRTVPYNLSKTNPTLFSTINKKGLEPCEEPLEEDEEEGEAKDEVGEVEHGHRELVHRVPVHVEREEARVLKTKHSIDKFALFLSTNLKEKINNSSIHILITRGMTKITFFTKQPSAFF